MTNPHSVVQINLTIHAEQDDDDLRILFPFDTQKDNIDQVVKELVNEINLTDEEGVELKAVIENQLKQALGTGSQSSSAIKSSSGVAPVQPSNLDESDDADVLNDREYQALLSQQAKQLADIELRHSQEQKELIAKLQRGTPVTSSQNPDDLIFFG
ncbi:hypothetical protein TVAG_266640 [Trichomonas vaginalis G3]|uniref:Uncharacterized protein n=1 Tax=Trichomonas vaginalis (strain ATCC PRA-98 / G3) TaxID=412133 RepID=A2DQL7_TRIV3|nr:hypothetical protein TVAGG3_0591620 [Trichomonas vaginalis G3]EAY17301.1 hypothetical protein TVAG_266640 [Trichomonas vaginalis G3]KAI5523302.1 hypothetical protein TVAGG3_0591620 [Trichomonas vaginalis G3]|eukprot:XP_001329524.1 hypothetical protein [Trichomonas vaginalis G3]